MHLSCVVYSSACIGKDVVVHESRLTHNIVSTHNRLSMFIIFIVGTRSLFVHQPTHYITYCYYKQLLPKVLKPEEHAVNIKHKLK